MDELLSAVLDAHGGLDNWQRVRTLRVGFSRGGPFWAARGWPDLLANETVTLDAHRQHIEFTPFLAQRSLSSPVRRLAFEISERRRPPSAC